MSRIEKALVFGILGAGALAVACGDSEETLRTLTPIVTNLETPPPSIIPTTEVTPTPLLTPEFMPAPAFESLPAVPDEFKTSWQAILDYWKTLQHTRGSLRLVENEKVRIDVVRTGTGEVPVSNGLNVIIENPGSADVARQVKEEITREICGAASPIFPEGISWNSAVPNSVAGPYEDPLIVDLGFTPEQVIEFRSTTNCETVSQ